MREKSTFNGHPDSENNLEELYTCISINPRMFGNETLFKNVFMKRILEGLGKKATLQQKQLAK